MKTLELISFCRKRPLLQLAGYRNWQPDAMVLKMQMGRVERIFKLMEQKGNYVLIYARLINFNSYFVRHV